LQQTTFVAINKRWRLVLCRRRAIGQIDARANNEVVHLVCPSSLFAGMATAMRLRSKLGQPRMGPFVSSLIFVSELAPVSDVV
jgi:hypothetical protein